MGKKSEKEHPRVFISYSHDSAEHAEKVLAFANKLREDGIDAVLDQYEESPPEGWPRWMDREIRGADFVLMICTETYYKRVMGEEEPGKGLGVRWESNLIYQHLYDADAMNRRFIPVLFDGADEKYVPVPAKGVTYYLVNSEKGYEGLCRRLTSQAKTRRPRLGEVKELPAREPKTSFFRVVSEDRGEGKVTEGAVAPASEWISGGKTEDTSVFADLKKRWEELKISKDVWKRGFAFERWLKDLLVAHGFYVDGSFRRKNPNEQIDGAIHFGFQTLLLEAKWLQQSVDGGEVDRFTGRLQRAVVGTHGLFFSAGGFNENAIKAADSWRSSRLILLADASHLESLVNQEFSGQDWVQTFCHLAARKGTVQVLIEEIRDELQRRGGGSVQKEKAAEVWFSDQWPKTDATVFGREKLLELLDKAWGEDKVRVVSFVAAGGVGKTGLVNRWKNFHMVPDKWRGAECVFGWSFYSQGSEIGRQVSADAFIKKALEWFGDKEMAESTRAPDEKGRRLAELVKRRRTLLLLDGLEPLQEPPGSRTGQEGQLRDKAVGALVRGLATGGEGLCVISTRVRIDDLRSYEGGTAEQVDLDNLTPEAGAAYLSSLGVHGRRDELVDASEEYGNHALALTLLGHFLKVHHGGDIRLRSEISNVMGTRRHRRHAEHIMAFYEKWFEGEAELELLHVLGLFDRPVERAAIDSVCGGDVIEGLTGKLNGLAGDEWDEVLYALREGRLISKDASREKLDCHPLVREHFGEKLKNERPEAWGEAHGRLYEYYKGLPEKELPDTLDEMEPLFRAVYHGCAAGEPTKVWEEVYWERMSRGEEAYSVKKLGAFGSDLGAVACFFEKVWERPASDLSEHRKAVVLNFAGFALRAVGRLREAAEPMEAAVILYEKQENWRECAINANNLSELYLTLGDVRKAVEYGRRCVEYAEKSGDEFWRMGTRTTLADALHQGGEIKEARRLFEEAERMQKERQPGYPYLYSVQGYQYCDLLLAEGKTEEVKEQARQTLEWVSEQGWLLDIALDKLSIGRAVLAEAASDRRQKTGDRSQKTKGRFKEAKRWLDEAVDGLRKAGTQDHLPRGLLSRAGYWRAALRHSSGQAAKGNYGKALGDLEEAREIAERGGMKLWLADYHLEGARLAREASVERSAGSVEEAGESWAERGKRHCEEALRLIKECGYHRRDGEVRELICD